MARVGGIAKVYVGLGVESIRTNSFYCGYSSGHANPPPKRKKLAAVVTLPKRGAPGPFGTFLRANVTRCTIQGAPIRTLLQDKELCPTHPSRALRAQVPVA